MKAGYIVTVPRLKVSPVKVTGAVTAKLDCEEMSKVPDMVDKVVVATQAGTPPDRAKNYPFVPRANSENEPAEPP